MAERVMRAMTAAGAAASEIAGMMRLRQLPYPDAGRTPSQMDSTYIIMSASQKTGIDRPERATTIEVESSHVLLRAAATMPSSIPATTAQIMAATASWAVADIRPRISLETGWRVKNERPKSPLTA